MKNQIIKKIRWAAVIVVISSLPLHLPAQRAASSQADEYTVQTPPDENTPPDGVKKKIEGTVTDEQGIPIIGATVSVKGHPDIGVTTDINGKFALEVTPRTILVIAYLGYNTQETRVGQRNSTYNIILKEDNQMLEEVVVVGYGTVKKSDLTGSVSTVGSRSFETQPVKSVSQILQGRTAGVEVTNSSGMPGAGAKVRIRGTTSINKSSDPLYVIDGIISSSGLDGLNPQDIQSMEV